MGHYRSETINQVRSTVYGSGFKNRANGLLIGFHTNFTNIPIYSDKYDLLQVSLGNTNDPDYSFLKDFDFSSYNNKNFCPVFIHSKHAYNISKKNIIHPIKEEISFLKTLNQHNTGIIIHLSKYHTDTREKGLIDVANKLNILCNTFLLDKDLSNFDILIETSYNINHLGSNIDDFYTIFKYLDDFAKKHIGICIDTSHVFLAGYPINKWEYLLEYLTDFDIKIGLKYLKLIHLNDINSHYLGKHSPHLSILDSNGKIFYKNRLTLELLVNFAKVYNIPIILERNPNTYNDEITEINSELDFIKNDIKYDMFETKQDFEIIIKNNISVKFIDVLTEYYYTLEETNYKNTIELLAKLKNLIIESYHVKNTKKYNLNKLIIEKKMFTYGVFIREDYKFFESIFTELLNNYNYEIFTKYTNNILYKEIKNFIRAGHGFIDKETAKKLIIEKDLHSINELANLDIKEKKKIFPDYKILTNYKLLKNHDFAIFTKIYDKITISLSPIYDITMYRSMFKSISDIDYLNILLVLERKENYNDFKRDLEKLFCFKYYLFNGDKKKSFILKHTEKNKNFFFIIDLYLCTPEEKIFMGLFLKNPIEKNIILQRIANSKGYVLNNYGLKHIKKNSDLKFKTETELLNWLLLL